MKIIVAVNRLPLTVEKNDKDEFNFKESTGGVATGLKSYAALSNTKIVWVGWAGITSINNKQQTIIQERMVPEYNPVFLYKRQVERFYYGFSNKTLWPLFHYFTHYTSFDEDYWLSYCEVNQIYADAVAKVYQQGDIVWIHDYQLMLLPALLREKLPEIQIGYFHHIPFPSVEVFRSLPSEWREKLLKGLMGADLIGFHTNDDTQNFKRCIHRLLGHEHQLSYVQYEDRTVKIDTFPMGVDFNRFNELSQSLEVNEKVNDLSKLFHGSIILSVDRLDYTKGIYNRLLGFQLFLEKNPQWHKKVNLILLLSPSREGVEHYQIMKRQIDETISLINGKFSNVSWTPIIYQYKTLSQKELIPYYKVSQVALITPLRDGMNLIAKEYLSCKNNGHGTIVLSEMAGAAKELGEAIIINPNSIKEISDGILQALEMPEKEQSMRLQIMRTRLKRYDILQWANCFLKNLQEVKKYDSKLNVSLLTKEIENDLIEKYKNAKRRLLLLDYDGTLVPFNTFPYVSPKSTIKDLLNKLSQHCEVVIISGRDKNFLEECFGNLKIGIVAEHGAYVKEHYNNEWRTLTTNGDGWKSEICSIMERYSDRVPGSTIEEKQFSVAWHYRYTDQDMSAIIAKELMDDLKHFATSKIEVLQGSKVVEVRNVGINKGVGATYFTSKGFDFVLAIGDDVTDEDMFKVIPNFTIKVGMSKSNANFNLPHIKSVLSLLQKLTN